MAAGSNSMRERLAGFWRRVAHFRDDRDLKNEVGAHIDMLTEEYVDRGVPPEEARRLARVEVGNPQVLLERVRDQEFVTTLESWYRDLAMGIRAIRNSPVFSFTAILTLALGIGANTAIFTLLYGLVLRSLPVPDARRLVRIGITSPAMGQGGDGLFMLYSLVQELRREQRSFTDISAWRGERVLMKDQDGALRFQSAQLVSGNAFQVLGLKPYIGRLIEPADDVRGGSADGWPVVLSYGFWKDHFGADPSVIGKRLTLSEAPAFVVGVTPPDFHGMVPGVEAQLALPIQFMPVLLPGGKAIESSDRALACAALARLRRGVSAEEAKAEIAVYEKRLLDIVPANIRSSPYFRDARFKIYSARTGFPSFFGRTYTQPLYIMQALVAIVLLLCCLNVGGLMMAKAYARRYEFAVRTAIGAARSRLVRQFLTESLVIGAAGAAAGTALAWYGNGLLLHFFRHPMIGEWMSVQPDKTVLAVTVASALFTTLAFGSFPALIAGRTDVSFLMRAHSRVARRLTAANVLVPMQVATSLALLAIAILLSQSLLRLRTEHTGFDVDHVTIQTAPFQMLRKQGDERLDLYQRMVDRMNQMPGVNSAAVTWMTPMTGIQETATFEAASDTGSPRHSQMAYNDVGPGYFRTMKTAILAGREFERTERDRSVCMLNQSAADVFFPHQQPLGGIVRSMDEKQFPKGVTCRVVGIAEDAKFAMLREPPPRTVYFPLTRDTHTGNLVFLINSPTKLQSIAGYRKALGEIAPTVPLVLFATLEEQMDAALGSERLMTAITDFFGVLALLLSGISLYGLLASSVAQRTAEIGIRIALGAQRSRVVWMIATDALRLVGAGVLAGCVMLLVSVRFVRQMLYGVSEFDPLTWGAAVLVLIGIAVLAAFVPAMRAASVQPMQALRAE